MERALTIEEFGDQLLRTQDLDPVYVAIASANLPTRTLSRLCLAYWCFYNLGVAARLAESRNAKHFWDQMGIAARNEGYNRDGSRPWPRGAERRHFRGAQAIAAVTDLRASYGRSDADALIVELFDALAPTFLTVTNRVKRLRGFGPWIAFKIADMGERVLGQPVDFSDCTLGIYKDPRQGAALARFGDWKFSITDRELEETVNEHVAYWRKKKAKAPPHGDRLVNVQEIETIFCKYKSHVKGHYPLGKDTIEVAHALEGWGDLAQQLKKGMPVWHAQT